MRNKTRSVDFADSLETTRLLNEREEWGLQCTLADHGFRPVEVYIVDNRLRKLRQRFLDHAVSARQGSSQKEGNTDAAMEPKIVSKGNRRKGKQGRAVQVEKNHAVAGMKEEWGPHRLLEDHGNPKFSKKNRYYPTCTDVTAMFETFRDDYPNRADRMYVLYARMGWEAYTNLIWTGM